MAPGSMGGRGELRGYAQAQHIPAAKHSTSPCIGCLGGRGASDHCIDDFFCGFSIDLFNRSVKTCRLFNKRTLLLCHSIPTHYPSPHLPMSYCTCLWFHSAAPPVPVSVHFNTCVGVLQSNPPIPPTVVRRNKLTTTCALWLCMCMS